MDERLFENIPFGKLKWEQNGSYYNFEPNLLPLKYKESPELSRQAEKTTLILGVLKGLTMRLG